LIIKNPWWQRPTDEWGRARCREQAHPPGRPARGRIFLEARPDRRAAKETRARHAMATAGNRGRERCQIWRRQEIGRTGGRGRREDKKSNQISDRPCLQRREDSTRGGGTWPSNPICPHSSVRSASAGPSMIGVGNLGLGVHGSKRDGGLRFLLWMAVAIGTVR